MYKIITNPVIYLMMIASFLFYSCSFSSKTAREMLHEVKDQQFDVVIVPGVPLEDGKWSPVMKARIYWSKYLFEKGIAKNIMYSGSAVHSPYVESHIMAMYAEAIGIPKENIFQESKAEHSTQNIYYSYQLAKKLEFNNIALASDPFQSKMLKRFTRRNVSKEVVIIPFVMDTLYGMLPYMIDPVIDREKAFVQNFIPLKEREGFWKRIKGTIGLDINKVYYQ